MAFRGRTSPAKPVNRAIEIARWISIQIEIAAKVDAVDRHSVEDVVVSPRNDPVVEAMREVGGGEQEEHLGNAYALRFPLDWPEPFGSGMIEAQPKRIDAA